ncbi:MAG: TolC family protein [Salinisphaera sp.]|nr:TolC family protein [Salinisphaera sp.]
MQPQVSEGAFYRRDLQQPRLAAFARALRGSDADWPPTHWRAGDLFVAALYFRYKLAAQRADLRAARAGVMTAGRTPPLGINLTFEHDSHPDESGASPWSFGAILDFLIPGPGQREARIAAAEARAQVARARLGTTTWTLREQVFRRYLELQRLHRQLRLSDRARKLLTEAAGMLARRGELGMVGAPTVSNMRLRLQRARLTWATVHADLTTARIALADAIGVPAAALAKIPDPTAPGTSELPQPPALTAMRRRALTGRYDIHSALAEYALADAELRAAVAEQYPDITLSPGILFDQGDAVWLLNLSWLFVLPGHHDGPIIAARARRGAAAARFRGLQTRVIGAVAQALAQYQGRLDVLTTARNVLAAQHKVQTQVSARVDAGYTGRLALLTTQLETLSARRARVDAWSRARVALTNLETQVQTGLGQNASADELVTRFVAGAGAGRKNGTGP